MEILKIYLKKQRLIKYYVINHLVLLKINGNQRGLPSMAYKFFNKKTSDSAVKSEIMPN